MNPALVTNFSNNGNEEVIAFKYNEEKTLLWLKKKTERVAEILRQRNIYVTNDDTTCTTLFRTSGKDSLDNNNLYNAFSIVSEYLVEDLSQKLYRFLNISNIKHTAKRKSIICIGSEPKRVKVEECKHNTRRVLDFSRSNVNFSRMSTTKEKALAKAALGSKSLNFFFGSK